MKLHVKTMPVLLGASLLCAVVAHAQSAAPAPEAAPGPENATFEVEQIFAGTCGFCHSDGGRAPGKGPQLMNSPRDDDFLRNRILHGKQGAMPAFDGAFTGAQIDQIVKYIRALKPREG